MSRLILSSNDESQIVEQSVGGQKQLVGGSGVLQVTPKTLNRVEGRTIRRQPENEQAMLKQRQSSLDLGTPVVGSIVDHQHHNARWIALDHQVLDELNESLAVFDLHRQGGHVFCRPVE